MEISDSVERTLLTTIILIGGGLLVWHFGGDPAAREVVMPMVASGWTGIMAYWFAGKRANGQP